MESLPLRITDNSKHIQQKVDLNKYDSGNNKDAKALEAAKQFETMLASMMVKSMTKASGGMFGGENFGGDMFDMVFENKLASFLTEKHNFGIADKILEKMPGIPEQNKINATPAPAPATAVKAQAAQPIGPQLQADAAEPLKPSNGSLNRLNKYEKYIDEASKKFGVDKNLIKSVILTESAGNVKAISKAKAKGLMQLMDGTAKDMGVRNVWSAKENIFGGTKYLSQMMNKFGKNLDLTLAAYNAGPGNVAKYDGIPPFEETKNYITRVKGYFNYLNG